MANVTGTDKFFDDPRFDTAGVLLGIDGDLVRCKMQRLWSWQTERYTPETPSYVVGRAQIVGIFKLAAAPEALVEAGLAEPREGGLYIKGTEGVIEWLWKKRVAGKKGRAAQVKSGADRAHPGHHPGTTQGADRVLTGPWDPGSGIRSSSLRSEEERETPAAPAFSLDTPVTPPVKPDPIADLWAEQTTMRAEAIPGSRPLGLTADRRKAIAALLKAGYSFDDLRVCLVQYATRARVEPDSATWFDGVSNWRPDNVARALGKVGTSRGRAGPVRAPMPAGDGRPLTGLAATAEILAERNAARPYVDPFKPRGNP